LKVTLKITSQVKDYRLIGLTREYNFFKIESNERIHETHTRFIIFLRGKDRNQVPRIPDT
jgi:hypothetical protein